MGSREANQILTILVVGIGGMTLLSFFVGMADCGMVATGLVEPDYAQLDPELQAEILAEIEAMEAGEDVDREAFERRIRADLEAYHARLEAEQNGQPLPPVQVERVENMPGVEREVVPAPPASSLDSAALPAVIALGAAGLVFGFITLFGFLFFFRNEADEDEPEALPAAAGGAPPPPPPAMGRSITPANANARVDVEIGVSGRTVPPSERVRQAQRRASGNTETIGGSGQSPEGFDEYGRPLDYEGESHTAFYLQTGAVAVGGGCLLLLLLIGPMPLAFYLAMMFEG